MRDEKDPGTIEMSLRKKAGRRPDGEVAMTDAERARAYRQRRRASRGKGYLAPVDPRIADGVSNTVLLDTLRDAVMSATSAEPGPADVDNVKRLLGLIWLRVENATAA